MRTPPLPHQAEPIRCQVRSLIEGQGHLRRTKPRKHLTSLSAISILISHKIAILGIEREGSGSSTLDVAVILSRWDPMVRFIPFPEAIDTDGKTKWSCESALAGKVVIGHAVRAADEI
jgi:hypothetical protein